MYIPSAFEQQDRTKLATFMEQHSFATLVTQSPEGVPFASHIPLLLEKDSEMSWRLVGHLARANPQAQQFQSGREVLAVFHGPHAYISPRWYQAKPAVPTWNYAAVHAYGAVKVITDEARLMELVRKTVSFYEGDGPEAWDGELPPEYFSKMLRGIVGFEIEISRLEGKFKLGQNRSVEDMAGVYNALQNSKQPEDRLLAELMQQEGIGQTVK